MVKINLKGVTKIYGKGDSAVTALKNVNLKVEKGEFISIMGVSGSGKSTLLNIIGCVDKPADGIYELNGVDYSKESFNELSKIRNKEISFIFQNFALIEELTVKENIFLPLDYRKGKVDKKKNLEELEKMGLVELFSKKVKDLSGGQKQRVAIGRSLVQGSEVILADEPTGALDEENSKIIMELLEELNKEGKTIIVVTHNKFVESYSKRKLYMKDGNLSEAIKIKR
ncbi:MAG: ABC transporter ATP-binding protein [Clostridium sp.]|uniref:ABC transporter ATP-binding protein n=1 Tax=Clostridium sp. TaxID=1506 RepID=UPI003EE4E236